MSPDLQFDDDAVEAIIRGEATDAALPQFAAFTRHVRAVGDSPAPRPSMELAALLTGHEDPEIRPVAAPTPSSPSRSSVATGRARRSKRRHRVPVIEALSGVAAKVAGLGALGKVTLGTGAAVLGTATAGAVGVAPAAISDPVQGAVEVVTPLELGDGDSDVVVDAGADGASVGADVNGVADAGADVDTGEVVDGATDTATGAVGQAEGVVDGAADTATGAAGAAVDEVGETTGDVVDAVEEEVNETPVGPVVPDLPEVTVPTTLPTLP